MIIALGSDHGGGPLKKYIVESFLRARFSGEARHRRRLGKIAALEKTSQT